MLLQFFYVRIFVIKTLSNIYVNKLISDAVISNSLNGRIIWNSICETKYVTIIDKFIETLSYLCIKNIAGNRFT